MNKKLLTISIASYNTEKFIKETVGSLIVDSEYMDKLEVIIVNDGSKDMTSKIAHELERNYPNSIIVIDKPNGGYGSTINASLSVARGKYYKLLDGDDWYNTESLTNMLNYIEQVDSDIIVSPYYEMRENRNLVDNHLDIPVEKANFNDISIDNKLFVMHEITIKTDLLRGLNRTITENCFYTDSEYVFNCLLVAKTISRFDKPVYIYRLGVDGQSVSLEGIRKHYKDLPVVAERIMKTYNEVSDEISGEKKDVLDLCIRNITYHTYRAFMLLKDSEKNRNELIRYDEMIRTKYPNMYVLGNCSRLVSVSRKLKFHFWGALTNLAYKKFRKEN